MVARGRVQNGVVVLGRDVHLPDGQEVTVLVPETGQADRPTLGALSHSVLDIPSVRLGRVLHMPDEGDDLLSEMLEDRP